MITVLSEKTPIARKKYRCDASNNYIDSSLDKEDMGVDDWKTILAAKKDRWAIFPGMRYRKSVYVDAGVFYTYRARLDMDAICAKYGLFDE